MKKATVTLDEAELMELDRILLDSDEEEALRYLEEIKKKITASRSRSCGITSSAQ